MRGDRHFASEVGRAPVLPIQQQNMHNAGVSTSITVRDVPDEVRDELAARAARAGRSLQEHLRRELIEMARRPAADALLARVRARKEATSSRLPPAAILADREAERR